MFKTLTKNIAVVLSMCLMVACGGGGDDAGPVNNPPPPVGGPPTPPPVSVTPPTEAKASGFLQQATFGATLTDIDNVVNRGFEGWIDWQQNLSPTTHLSYYNQVSIAADDQWSQHVNAWWMRSLTANDQLRQRVAYALSQIMVIGQNGVDADMRALSNYYDVLLRNAFGNYRDLIEDVTLNPVMGEYLSMLRNEKPDTERNIRPDENYARELMQLFSIGLVELDNNGEQKIDGQGNPIPTYDQDIIEGFAHVFTGWTWGNAENFYWWSENRDLLGPMKVFPEFHDNDEKQVLNGVIIPAGQTPEKDLADALDNIFEHPNVGPFLSKQLIQKLVTSNPSPQYIERVVNVFNNNGSGVRGDLGAVVKAILLDDEARKGVTSPDKIFGKVKEPLLRLSALWRAFNASAANGIYDFRWGNDDFSQAPLQSPSVFNFFSPSFSPQGEFQSNDWVAPEMQIHSEGTMAKMTNHLHWRSISQNNFAQENPDPTDILINITRERDLASEPEALLDHLDLLLMAGKMTDGTRRATLEFLTTYNDDELERKAADAIALIITSPEFSVQQ